MRGILNCPNDKIMFEDAEAVLELTDGPNAEGWLHGHCPFHRDDHPSLAVLEAEDGGLVVFCHAGCGPREIYTAIREMLEDV